MPTVLVSVSDKTGIIDFAQELSHLGWRIIASGGTAQTLKNAYLQVEDVASYTHSPEILGGRVKTLHPAVHGGILARDISNDLADLERINASYIDMVVVNLYPFQKTVKKEKVTLGEAIEQIDIGGVALLRAAAKNHVRVTVLCDPIDYPVVTNELREAGQVQEKTRRSLAIKAFRMTAAYDRSIAEYLEMLDKKDLSMDVSPEFLKEMPGEELRYGENPHQIAHYYHLSNRTGPLGGELLQGKALSYTNLLDLDAAWRAVVSFDEPAACIVKHLSPCGMAADPELGRAFKLALQCDPISAFGGVIALNRLCDSDVVTNLGDLFVECIIAPGFSPDALSVLGGRKNCRLICMSEVVAWPPYELRSVNHGILWQTHDPGDPTGTEYRVVTEHKPDEGQMEALKFAMKVCQHVKSNSIVLAQGKATVGIGGGQPNRVDSARIAIRRAGERAHGAVLASDAFFPFPDWVEEAAQAGVVAVIQPGGSLRDDESIKAANHFGIAMVFTGVRHFRH